MWRNEGSKPCIWTEMSRRWIDLFIVLMCTCGIVCRSISLRYSAFSKPISKVLHFKRKANISTFRYFDHAAAYLFTQWFTTYTPNFRIYLCCWRIISREIIYRHYVSNFKHALSLFLLLQIFVNFHAPNCYPLLFSSTIFGCCSLQSEPYHIINKNKTIDEHIQLSYNNFKFLGLYDRMYYFPSDNCAIH